jgi:CheY-like chemotaxis protein
MQFKCITAYADEIFAQMNLNAQVGNYVLVTISDTGTGIPAEFRDRIFDPFFTTKAPGLGTGLGLSSSLGIVKSYGGFLQVVSEVGVGTEVKVFLPATEGIPTESQTEAELLQGKGELVLIVDDDLAVQRINQSLLESNHYTTLVANDGIDALSLYASHQRSVKVILIDVMMPNMDGVTAVRTLRNINPSVKIIAISGLTSNREPVLAAGADVFLSKPYTLEHLLRTISDLVKSSG